MKKLAMASFDDHLSRCLDQIATIAGMQTPTDGLIALVSRGVSSATPSLMIPCDRKSQHSALKRVTIYKMRHFVELPM